jgi:hypothetical protein
VEVQNRDEADSLVPRGCRYEFLWGCRGCRMLELDCSLL